MRITITLTGDVDADILEMAKDDLLVVLSDNWSIRMLRHEGRVVVLEVEPKVDIDLALPLEVG